MPESSSRKKAAFTPPPTRSPVKVGNPRWLVPVMLALFLIGLAWIVVFYLSQGQFPLDQVAGVRIGQWNLAIGFGFVGLGFLLATRWR